MLAQKKKQKKKKHPQQTISVVLHGRLQIFQGLQTCTSKASQAFKAFKASLGTSELLN